MDGIKIKVDGTVVRVVKRPPIITSGTVGMPIEFEFDEQWDNLWKLAVFQAGSIVKTIEIGDDGLVVPWEVLEKPCMILNIGVYGTNAEGNIVIPSVWANVCPIINGVDPEGDHTTEPTQSMWQMMLEYIKELATKPALRVDKVFLPALAWEGADGFYSQVVEINGVSAYSQVDLKPSAEQLYQFRQKDIALSTENSDGVVTVYVIGDKPTDDYTMEVSITEVVA